MINANELRIGNWVLDNKVFRKVTGIKLDDLGDCVRLDDAVTNRLIKNIFPIPLTPEILEGCGFINIQNKERLSHTYILPGFELLEMRRGYILDGIAIKTKVRKIVFLHQLQNLYFALTGEELQIKISIA